MKGAVRSGIVSVVKAVVEAGADIGKYTFIGYANKGGHVEVLEFLLSSWKVDVNKLNISSENPDMGSELRSSTPLLWVLRNGSLDMVKCFATRWRHCSYVCASTCGWQ